MSFESLLLLAFLLLVPLLERLAGAMRARRRSQPADQAPVPAPPGLALPLPPAPARAERLTSRKRAPAHVVIPNDQVAPELAGHATPRRRPRRIVGADLRHSIVMMTILGPCRAADDSRGPR
jgi:hypothetical protein